MNYGRYQIVSELGRGSMGVVYKAHDPQINRPIALKVLREDRVISDDFVRRFMQEAMAVGRLSHPGIVTVYDVGQDQGTIYIAMEYLQGTSLGDLLKSKTIDLPEIIDIGIQAAQALHYAHQNGIVHRDIKPPNIIYSPEGTVRLTDFGIARIEDPGGHQMTQAGEILGTPLYMSPEQVAGQPLDGRSDLYSLGVILYRMTTGRMPFEGSSLAAIFSAITQKTPEAPDRLTPAIPKALSSIIMKLLEKDPAKRFSTGSELIEALKGALQSKPSQRGPSKQIQKERTIRPVYSILLCLAASVVIAGLIGAYAYFTRPNVSPKPPQQTTAPAIEAPQNMPSQQTPSRKQDLPQEPVIRQQAAKSPKTLLDKPKGQTPTSDIKKNTKPDNVAKVKANSLQALLKMESRPSGATLYIDGTRMGKTPVTTRISAEKHEVRLQLDNYLGWEAQLDLSKGGEVPLSIHLLPKRQ